MLEKYGGHHTPPTRPQYQQPNVGATPSVSEPVGNSTTNTFASTDVDGGTEPRGIKAPAEVAKIDVPAESPEDESKMPKRPWPQWAKLDNAGKANSTERDGDGVSRDSLNVKFVPLQGQCFGRLSDDDAKVEPQLAALSEDGTILVLEVKEGLFKPKGMVVFDVRNRRQLAYVANVQSPNLLSANGRLLAAQCMGGETLLWDVARNQPKCVLNGPGGALVTAGFSKDGSRIALLHNVDDLDKGVERTIVSIWDLASGRQIGRDIEEISPIKSVAWSHDNHRLATGGVDGLIAVWNVDNGKREIGQKLIAKPIKKLLFAPDDKTLVTLCGETHSLVQQVMLWDVVDELKLRGTLGQMAGSDGKDIELRGRARSIDDIRWNAASDHLLSFAREGGIYGGGHVALWNVRDGALIDSVFVPSYNAEPGSRFGFQHFTSDLSTNVSEANERIDFHDVAGYFNRVLAPRAVLTHPVDVNAVAFTADGKQIASGGEVNSRNSDSATANGVVLWKADAVGPNRKPGKKHAHPSVVKELIASPRGDYIAARGYDRTADLKLSLWDFGTNKDQSVFSSEMPKSIAFSPDGKLLAVAFHGEKQRAGEVPGKNGDRVFRSLKPCVALWDVECAAWTGTLGSTFDKLPLALAFSHSGDNVAIALQAQGTQLNPMIIRNVRTGADQLLPDNKPAKAIAFLPGDQQLVSLDSHRTGVADGSVNVWDVAAAKITSTINVEDEPSCMDVSVDGKVVGVGTWSFGVFSVDVFNLTTGRRIATLRPDVAETSRINSLKFSPDGATLALAHDAVVSVWDWKAALTDNVVWAKALTPQSQSTSEKADAAAVAADDAASHHQRAVAFAKLENPAMVIEECAAALKLDPRHAGALTTRGAALLRLHRYSEALDDLKSAIDVDPKDIDGLQFHGQALAELRRWPEAADDFGQIIEAKPEAPFWYWCRAWTHFRAKRYTDAIADCTEGVSRSSDPWMQADIYSLRAESRRAMGDGEGSKEDESLAVSAKGRGQQQFAEFKRRQELLSDSPSAGDRAGRDLMGSWYSQKAGMLGAQGVQIIFAPPPGMFPSN